MKKEYILAITAVVLWSTLSPVTKLVLNRIPIMETQCIGSFIAFIFLLILNVSKKQLTILKMWKPADYVWVCSLGFVGLFLYSSLYYYGIDVMSAGDACIINYLWPLMIVIFSVLFLKESMTAAKLIAILLSFAGVVVVATKGDFSGMGMNNISGVAACMGAAICYGLFSVLNKKLAYNQNVSMMFFFGVSAVASGVVSVVCEEIQPVAAVELIGLLWIGVLVNAVAYLSWALALNGGETAKISNFAYITPFLSVLVSYVLLKETVSAWSFVGLSLIIAGIFIQLKDEKEVS